MKRFPSKGITSPRSGPSSPPAATASGPQRWRAFGEAAGSWNVLPSPSTPGPRTRPPYVPPWTRRVQGGSFRQEALSPEKLASRTGHLRMLLSPSGAGGQMPLSPPVADATLFSPPETKQPQQYSTAAITELEDEGEQEQRLFLGIFPDDNEGNLEYCAYMTAYIAGVIILLLIVESAASAYFQYCDVPVDCFKLDKELERSRYVEVDPCHDMFAHVCGRWTSMYPDQPDQFEVLNNRLRISLLENIDEASTSSSSAVDKAGAALYSCMRVGEDGVDRTSTIRDVLDRHGLRFPAQESRSTRDVFRILVALTLQDLLGVFFQLKLTPYVKADNQFVFELKYAETMYRYVTNEEVMAACVRAYDPALRDVTDLAKSLLHVENDVRTMTDMYSPSDQEPEYSKLRDIEIVHSEYDQLDAVIKAQWWVDDINENIPKDAAITLDTEILIREKYVLLVMGGVLRAYKTRSVQLQSFIAWKVIKYLSYTASSRMFYCHFPLGRAHWMHTFANALGRCTGYVKVVMPHALLQLQLKNILDEETVNYAHTVAERIMLQMEISYNFSWLDAKSAKGVVERLRSIHQIIGTASKFRSESALDSYYQHIPESSPELKFADWLVVAHRSVAAHKKRFLQPSATDAASISKDDWEISGISVGAFYVIVYHIIYVPGSILMPPFMVPDGPNTYNYGAIGKVIGHEISHAFDTKYLDVNPRGEKHVFYTRQFARMLEKQRDCLILQANKMTRSAIAGNNSISEAFADNAGVEAAYLAYAALPKSDRQAGAGSYTADQAFFAGGCFMFCQGKDDFSEFSIYLPHNLRCNQPCINTQEFAEAFRCKKGSPMFPRRRCDIHDTQRIMVPDTR
ncbi:neprilysin-like [Amblyomma americanum]